MVDVEWLSLGFTYLVAPLAWLQFLSPNLHFWRGVRKLKKEGIACSSQTSIAITLVKVGVLPIWLSVSYLCLLVCGYVLRVSWVLVFCGLFGRDSCCFDVVVYSLL